MLAIDPSPGSSDANIRARKSCMDAIHSARPFGWIEQPDVSFVHMQTGEPSVSGSLSKHLAAVGIPFDGADGGVSKNEVCEEPPPRASEEMKGSHVMPPSAWPACAAADSRGGSDSRW